MDYCECGRSADFRCECGTTLCGIHVLGTFQYRTGLPATGFCDVREQVWQGWSGRPRRCCGRCYVRHTREVAAALAAESVAPPDDLALALLAANAWDTADDFLMDTTLGHEVVLAAAPSPPSWLRKDALDTAGALLASRSQPTKRNSFFTHTTRDRLFGSSPRPIFTEIGDSVLAWQFCDPDYESNRVAWIGSAGGNLLNSEASGLHRVDEKGRFGWWMWDAAPETLDGFRRRLLTPPPKSRELHRLFVERIARVVAREALI